MSINSELYRIEQNTTSALSAISEYGVEVAPDANSDNLSELIHAIPRATIVQDLGDSTTKIMSQKAVTDALASLSQLAPEHAGSIEELMTNGDTSKLYVLPDGYIYAYMTLEESSNYTNALSKAIDLNNAVYNGVGYKNGYRISVTSFDSALDGLACTGLIPIKAGDVLRFKNCSISQALTNSRAFLQLYNSEKEPLTDCASPNTLISARFPLHTLEGDNLTMMTLTPLESLNWDTSNWAYIRLTGESFSETSIITVNEEIPEETGSSSWANTGLAFVPADYEPRIINLEDDVASQETRIKLLESSKNSNEIPSYWLEELEEKADAIRKAIEAAGRRKSAFLWYTDSHWTYGNSKISPALLQYLYKYTPINKVNFGGDIVVTGEDRKYMKYLYSEWRKAVQVLPNHHSVVGNHDILVNYPYAFLIASEESSDMVMGGDLYYYIDSPCEQTRYIYLDSGRQSISDEEITWLIDVLKSTQDGWHIIVISHIWFQYTNISAPTVGIMNTHMQKVLNLFDAYNARESSSITMVSAEQTYDFSTAGGKVEFCIGGHLHVDHDLTSARGIPVILTASDVNQERSENETEDYGSIGTITESAVFGIIANYESGKISVIGIGRGTSRTISLNG